MHKVFIDSDVIIDVFARRKPHFLHSARLLSAVENHIVKAFSSPLVFANIYYILRRFETKEFAMKSLRKLRLLVKVLKIDSKTIDQALNSTFTDFEDAIQYYSAKTNKMNFIITRNIIDFKKSTIPVCTPEEFLLLMDASNLERI